MCHDNNVSAVGLGDDLMLYGSVACLARAEIWMQQVWVYSFKLELTSLKIASGITRYIYHKTIVSNLFKTHIVRNTDKFTLF